MGKKQKSYRKKDISYRPYDWRDIYMKKRKGQGKVNIFIWSLEQETLYVQFLENNKNMFSSLEERKKNRVFVLMSQYLRKRGPDQCRSHHQKMEIKYKTIDSIIQNVTKNKLCILKPTEQDIIVTQTWKQQSNTFTSIKEQKDETGDQKHIQNHNVCTPSDFQEGEKHLWKCVVQNVWLDS